MEMSFALWDRTGFATKLNAIEQAPEPLRGALTRTLRLNDSVRCLIFGPIQKVIGKVSPASLLAILNDEWVVIICGEDGQPKVYRCDFTATLFAELTESLLYGRLRLAFVERDHVQAVEVHFNTVMDWLYREALELLLRGLDGGRERGSGGGNRVGAVEVLPLKFRNGIRRYLPAGDDVLEFVHWPAAFERRWYLFWRERSPEGVLLLTKTQLLLISEEKAWWLGRTGTAKYGYVVTYWPLSRVASVQVTNHEASAALDVTLSANQFCAGFKIDFPDERRAAVEGFVKTVPTSQTANNKIAAVESANGANNSCEAFASKEIFR
jgi:hypothetical protein